jgi:hypothetical protein
VRRGRRSHRDPQTRGGNSEQGRKTEEMEMEGDEVLERLGIFKDKRLGKSGDAL